MARIAKPAPTTPRPEPVYPEHEKLRALRTDPADPFSGKNQLIGDFIEWLPGEHITLAVWLRVCHRCQYLNPEDADCCQNEECEAPNRALGSPRLWPARVSREELIGRFFGIDPAKLNAEKDQMLDAIRKGHS